MRDDGKDFFLVADLKKCQFTASSVVVFLRGI